MLRSSFLCAAAAALLTLLVAAVPAGAHSGEIAVAKRNGLR